MEPMRLVSLILLPLAACAAEYQLCFLVDGPQSGMIEKSRATDLQAQHMAHIQAMYKAGALEGAGPVGNLAKARGIFLFATSAAEAERLAAQDPKVIAGDLKLACSTWQGPAGIGKGYREAEKQPGFQNKMARRVAVLLPRKPEAPLDGVIAAGPLKGHPEATWFAVLNTEDWERVRNEHPLGKAFIWFHDIQIWIGVS